MAGKLFPDRASEIGPPVAGEFSVPDLFYIEKSAVFSLWIPAGFFEPEVFIGAVIYHQVHDDIHVSSAGLLQQAVHVLHAAEAGVYSVVIRYVIALVCQGRNIDGREPDDIHAQIFQIIQTGDDARQISDPVPVAVQKALGIDLIGCLVMPPLFFHRDAPFSAGLIISRFFL